MTIDEDVATLLDREMRRSGTSFKDVVNDYLRLGLAVSRQPKAEKFVVEPRNLGLPAGLSYDRVQELLDAVEGASGR